MSHQEPTVILVIDSDNVRRGMLACSLPTSRYVLEFAKTTEAGLDLLGQRHPDVVLIGFDANTEDLCQRIRLLPAGARCVLMLMDERFSEAGDAPEAEAAGADVALPFPFDLSLLESRLREQAKRPQNRTEGGIDPAARSDGDETGETPANVAEARDADPDAAWRSFRERVEGIHGKLDELDYYQLLDVPRASRAAAIKDAYFDRSIELHPDRFLGLEDSELKTKIYEVYKRISEGFRVLIQPASRARYDVELMAPAAERKLRFNETDRAAKIVTELPSDASTPAGKRYVRLAELAEKEGNLKSARMYLTLAVQCEPQNGALRNHLDDVTSQLS